MNTTNNMRRTNIRRQLLITASATALFATAYGAGRAQAADGDRPQLWVEIGGQLEGMANAQEALSPSFMASITQANLLSTLNVQRPLAYALGTEGKILLQPDASDWVFSASIRYGRSAASHDRHQQTPNAKIPVHFFLGSNYETLASKYPNAHVKFADAASTQSENHVILDFQAGKDLGLGLFGNHGSFVLSVGVRFAQFSSRSSVNMHAEPDVHYTPSNPITTFGEFAAFHSGTARFHDDAASAYNTRSFHGVGPSLAWNGSTPVAGNPDTSELAFDWGANAAVLFGRQRASGHHQTTVRGYYEHGFNNNMIGGGNFQLVSISHHTYPANHDRARSVVVPNLGGFAGLSLKWSNAKISFGYRADFFFGAMDGGIDARKSETLGFYGPFATISVGLGG